MRRIFLLVFSALFSVLTEASALQDKSSVILGKVTDLSGESLAGAGVTIENTFLGVYCGADGSYSFSGLKDGLYNLRFSFIGYESQVVEVKLETKSVLDVRLVPKPLYAGEVIVNATRAGKHTPLAYSTIDDELLRKQNSGQDMPFLLSLTPSLVETSEAGNGIGNTSLRIRGTDANRINVTIDGIPINDPESQQVFWVDLPDLASAVESIQIQRGAGTSANGAGAFGATLNIHIKSPENEPFAQMGTSIGSFKTIKKIVAAGTGLIADRFAMQVRFSDLKSDGFIERAGSDHRSVYIGGVFRTEKSRLKANVILGEEHTGISWIGVPEEMLNVNRRYNPAGEYNDEEGLTHYYDNESDNYLQNHYQLIYSLKIRNNLNFSTAIHYTNGKGYYEQFKEDGTLSNYGLPDVIIRDTVISETDLIRRKWMSNDFYGLVYSLKFRKGKLETTLGGGANYYSGDHFGKIIWMRYPGNLEKDYQWYLNHGTKEEMSLYGKADYSVTDKISLFGDMQYRYIYYKMSGDDDDLKDLWQKHHFSFFSPKAGVFVSINKNQDAYLSLSVANREPTRTDFKEAAGDPNATPRPETLYDSEIGYKLRGEKYSMAFNLYGMFYNDQLVPTGELSSTGYSIMTNVNRSYRIGIEMNAGVKRADFFSWDFNLTLSRNKILNFIKYYVDNDEYKSKQLGTVDIAYSPAVISTSDMNLKVFRNTELHFISKYVGKQYFDNTMNSERMINPYFVNNLRIDFEPAIPKIGGAEFQVLINNIFNRKYESNAYGGTWYENGEEKTWAYFFPQAGINFIIRAGFTF